MVVHLKAFYGLIVLDDRVKRPFFKFLPVPAQIILSVRIEQKKEIFNVRDDLFQLEVISRGI